MTCAGSSARGAGRACRMVPWTVWRRRINSSERWLPAKPSIPVTRTVLAVLRLHHLEPLDARLGGQQLRLVGPFPGQVEVGATKVPVGRRLLVDGPAQLQLADDLQRAEVEVLLDQLLDFGNRHSLGAEGLDEDRNRLANADGVRDLNLAMAGKTGGHDVLGHVARGVGARTIDLRRVLTAKAGAPVPGVAAVAVDNDIPAGDACIGARAAEHEAPG